MTLAGYITRRLAWAVVVLLSVGVITFLFIHLVPADPARAIVGPHATAATVASIRHALGLDQPILVQLYDYLAGLLRLDLGHSYQRDADVLPLILERFPATAQLALAGIAIELAIGVPLGVWAARRRGSLTDRVSTLLASVLVAAPSFWVGYLFLNALAFQPRMVWGLDLFPIGTYQPFDLRYLFLPALTLGLSGAAYYTRIARTSMLEQLQADYILTARSKGLSDRRITWRHAFPNAFLPLLTQFGLDLGFFLGGIVVIEQVFSWPGIGRLAVEAIETADIPLIMGTVLFGTLTIVLANLLVDVAYVVVDPRLRNA